MDYYYFLKQEDTSNFIHLVFKEQQPLLRSPTKEAQYLIHLMNLFTEQLLENCLINLKPIFIKKLKFKQQYLKVKSCLLQSYHYSPCLNRAKLFS